MTATSPVSDMSPTAARMSAGDDGTGHSDNERQSSQPARDRTRTYRCHSSEINGCSAAGCSRSPSVTTLMALLVRQALA